MSQYDKRWTTVKVDITGGIAWVTLNRPEKRNAMSPTLNREMIDVLETLEQDPEAEVLVLTGAGDSWTAGMDLKEYFRENDGKPEIYQEKLRRDCSQWQWKLLRMYSKPTIAMVNGWCFGGGYGPLFACDLAFASDDAKFGLSEINWGILPGGGASKVAVELLSFRRAMYHAMLGENIDGRTAAEWGLVNESLPADRLQARVTEVAEALLQKNPIALKATKDAIRRVRDMSYDNAEDYLVRAQEAANSFDNEGRKEGMRQFLDDKTYKPGLGTYDLSKQVTP